MLPMRALLLSVLLAAPLAGELLDAEIRFRGTGCASCAESLEPRLRRIRGVETVELDLERSLVRLTLEPGNRARIAPLRLRVTQDGTKILDMSVTVQGVVLEQNGEWLLSVSGPNEALALETSAAVQLDAGPTYRLAGEIVEVEGGALMLRVESAERVSTP